MIEARLRPGYSALVTARMLASNDEAWLPLMRDVLRLPAWMLPAIQRTVIRGHWRQANDPLKSIRVCAQLEAERMGLGDQPPAKGSE
jgi:hypothetical protein